MIKNIRVCQKCGKTFSGSGDTHYCEDCVKKIKSNVVRNRICIDCGTSFPGGPRARRCPSCREIAKRIRVRRPAARPFGSTDRCERCGAEYTVESSRQKYCKSCQRDALLEWQREHKIGYHNNPEVIEKKYEKRKQQKKICKYCLRAFIPESSSQYCSEYCRKEQRAICICEYYMKHGYNRNLTIYEKKREQYRKEVADKNRQV